MSLSLCSSALIVCATTFHPNGLLTVVVVVPQMSANHTAFIYDCSSAGFTNLPTPSLTTPSISPTRLPSFSTFQHNNRGADDNDSGDNAAPHVLSASAVVGILIGVPIGLSLILGVVGLLCASYAKQKRKDMMQQYWSLPRLQPESHQLRVCNVPPDGVDAVRFNISITLKAFTIVTCCSISSKSAPRNLCAGMYLCIG
jgi:hypothetical protein